MRTFIVCIQVDVFLAVTPCSVVVSYQAASIMEIKIRSFFTLTLDGNEYSVYCAH